jgi:hypothetical protein
VSTPATPKLERGGRFEGERPSPAARWREG